VWEWATSLRRQKWLRLGSFGFVFPEETAFSGASGAVFGFVSHLFFAISECGEGREVNFELRITDFEKRQFDGAGLRLRHIIITKIVRAGRTSSTVIT
jgi:hypothetical protein